MNLTTITNMPSSNWKRATIHSVSAAVGVALALSAVAGLSGSLKSSDAGTTSARSVAPAAIQRIAEQNPLRVVLVNDVAQQQTLQAQLDADAFVPGYTLQSAPIVTVKGSALEQSLLAASSETAANGRDVKVTDLTQAAANVTPAAVLKASDADVMASVLSTERATYIAPVASPKASDAVVRASALSSDMAAYDFSAAQPAQRQVSDADLAASVLSTELATYLP